MAKFVLDDKMLGDVPGYAMETSDGKRHYFFGDGADGQERLGTAALAAMAKGPRGAEIEELGNSFYKDRMGLSDGQLEEWKKRAGQTESELNKSAARLAAEGMIPEGMEPPKIHAISAPQAASAISDAQATKNEQGRSEVGFIVDINGNYNASGAALFVDNAALLRRASGIDDGAQQKAFNKMNTEFILYHEIGHAVLDNKLGRQEPVLKLEGMSDAEAVGLQNYLIAGRAAEDGRVANESYAGDICSKTGQIAHENYADAFASIAYLRSHGFSAQAVENLKALANARAEEQGKLSQKDEQAPKGQIPEYGKIDEHRIENGISNVLAHLDEVKASRPGEAAMLAGKLALESTAITMKDAARARQDLSDAEGKPTSVLNLIGNYDLAQAAQRAAEVAGLDGGKYAADGAVVESAVGKFKQAMEKPRPSAEISEPALDPQEVAARLKNRSSGVPGAAVLGAIGVAEEERRARMAFAGDREPVPGPEAIVPKLESMRESQPAPAAENDKKLSM